MTKRWGGLATAGVISALLLTAAPAEARPHTALLERGGGAERAAALHARADAGAEASARWLWIRELFFSMFGIGEY